MNANDIHWLEQAIGIAARARAAGNHPFGAVLVSGQGEELARAENSVVTERDCTNHAETNLVRLASRQCSAEQLASSTLYTSTEPCAMCAGAIHWSGIGRIVYALSETELYEIVGPSPEHLYLPCREVFAHTKRAVVIEGPCDQLHQQARHVHEGFWR